MHITVTDPTISTMVFGLVSLIVIGVGICLIVRDRLLKSKCTATAQGTIVDVIDEVGRDGKTRFQHPIVSYLAEAIKHDIKISMGTIRCKHKVGDLVTVHYNPLNSAECYIKDGSGNQTIAGIAVIVFGVLVLTPTVLYAMGILK